MKKLTLLIFLATSASAIAQGTISGTVKDGNNSPVPGATILIKGTTQVVETDENGNFSLKTSKSMPFVLLVNSPGFREKQIEVYEFPEEPIEVAIRDESALEEVVVTSRRRQEVAQELPIPITVISGQQAEEAGSFNVNRLKEAVPSVQLYSSNGRNTTLNIRGLGSTFGLTNDGLDPGVGFYIDGVYIARPAATALDFVDVEQIEILRGPQGTLFGKNTTAGAFNITTRKPSFIPGGVAELSYGNYNFVQAKASITGGLNKKIATRISFSGTQRDGTVFNTRTNQRYNGQNNQGVKAQILYNPTDKIELIASGDFNIQRPAGQSLVPVGVTRTLRNEHRQYQTIANDLNYNTDHLSRPFDRKIDSDSPWRHDNELSGVSLNANFKLGTGTLTSTTAWRYWNWDPVNDRDFTGLPALTKSQAPSRHEQWSQEVRYAAEISKRISGVVGVYTLGQTLRTAPYHTEEVGSAQWRFQQSNASAAEANWATPGLLDGYGNRIKSFLNTFTAAAFTQFDIELFKGFHILPGIRYNFDEKSLNYERTTYGGLQTNDPALLARKRAVFADQSFNGKARDENFSYNLTLQYKYNERINGYATYSTSYKPVGVNLGGLPTITVNSQTVPDLSLATVRPEFLEHYEFGVKTKPTKNSFLNATYYHNSIDNYQTNVQAEQVGTPRGYLANAKKVEVFGAEVDAGLNVQKFLKLSGSVAYTVGRYVDFKNAPLPLEETGFVNAQNQQVGFKDASGGDLPGISRWTVNFGADLSTKGKFFGKEGRFYFAPDVYYRTKFSSNPTPSKVLNINAYSLLNARVGFRVSEGLSFIIWSRNLGNTEYFELLQPATGNSGLIVGVLGDPRTYGVTLRYGF